MFFGYSFEQLLFGFIVIGAVLGTIRLINDAYCFLKRKYKWFRYVRPLRKRGEALVSKAREAGCRLIYNKNEKMLVVCTPADFASGLEHKAVCISIRKGKSDESILQNKILERVTGISPEGIGRTYIQKAMGLVVQKQPNLKIPEMSDLSIFCVFDPPTGEFQILGLLE